MPPKTRKIWSTPPPVVQRVLPEFCKPESLPVVQQAATCVVIYMCGETLTTEAFDDACAACNSKADVMSAVFSALLTSAQQIVREKMSVKQAEKNLKDDLKIPADVVAAFLQPLAARFAEVEAAMASTAPSFSRLQDVRWRVDVHISNTVLNRLLKPTVLMQLILQDGQASTFEVSPEKFHDLRYNVAKLLQEMQRMESRLEKQLDSGTSKNKK